MVVISFHLPHYYPKYEVWAIEIFLWQDPFKLSQFHSKRDKVRHRSIGDESRAKGPVSRSRAVYGKLESNSEPERARAIESQRETGRDPVRARESK